MILFSKSFWRNEMKRVKKRGYKWTGSLSPRLEQEKLPFSILQNALREVLDGSVNH